MAIYVRAKGTMFSFKFSMESMETVQAAIHQMMSQSQIVRVSFGDLGCGFINFGALSEVQITTLSFDDMPVPTGPSDPRDLELVANLSANGGLELVAGIEAYLKSQTDDQV